jgi:hypothetical protein
MAERGVSVDHATLNRWVVRYSPFIAEEAKKRKFLSCVYYFIIYFLKSELSIAKPFNYNG